MAAVASAAAIRAVVAVVPVAEMRRRPETGSNVVLAGRAVGLRQYTHLSVLPLPLCSHDQRAWHWA